MKLHVWWFGVLIALLLLTGNGAIARFIFPLGAVVLGVYLFLRAREVYMDFTLWCWFLSPFLRRVIDYQAGWSDPSVVLLVPYLVTLVAPLLEWKRLASSASSRVVWPFIAAMVAIGYGTVLGLLQQPLTEVASSLLSWGIPVLFAWWYASADESSKALVRRSVLRSFLGGVLVIGLYGCFQFVFVPKWDGFWLVQVQSTKDVRSMGSPEPYQIRVFSTLNSPGTCATILAPGILLVTSIRRWWAIAIIGPGLCCLALTLGRAGWLCLGLGLLLVFFKSPRGVLRTLCVIGVAWVIFIILSVGPTGDLIQRRVSSFSKIGSDDSLADRVRGISDAIDLIQDHPAGLGLGVSNDVLAIDPGVFSLTDSGIVEAIVSLGWVGAAAFLAPLVVLAIRNARSRGGNSSIQNISGAVAIALLIVLPLGSVYLSPQGLLLWLFAAL